MVVGQHTGKISIDYKKCIGCRECEQACVFFREHEFNPRRARIRVLINEREGVYAPLLCNQCKECLSACNRDALSWDEKLGVVRVDVDKCNGCGLCIEVCPQEAIFLDPVTEVVNICDLCNGDPQCVKWCSEGVLKYEAA